MIENLTVGIVGGGTVGRALARAYCEFVRGVKIWDSRPERRTEANVWDALQSDITFVCLPTPAKEGGGGCDTSILEKFFEDLEDYHGNLVLKSTVPVGFTRKMARKYRLTNIVHSPEFLTSRCALHDAMNPSRNVIGRVMGGGGSCCHLLERFYLGRHPGVPVHVMTSDDSEAVKLFTNAYFAAKVGLFNEFQAYASGQGLNWDLIRDCVVADNRIEQTHTRVPGPDGKCGFGGECLPKDLDNLLNCMGEPYAKILREVARRNNNVDRHRSR